MCQTVQYRLAEEFKSGPWVAISTRQPRRARCTSRRQARVAGPIQVLPCEPQHQCDVCYMPGHVLHMCNLCCECLSQPLASCALLTCPHSLSCPIYHFLYRVPYAFPDCVVTIWHICCLDTGFECLPLLRLPFWRYRYHWNRLILYFPKSPKALQSDILNLHRMPLYCM
jgi:hypothetical protein